MTQRSEHSEFSAQIDTHLLHGKFEQIALIGRATYQPWYAQLLSSFALLVHGDSVVYARADHDTTTTEVRVIVFTNTSVLVANLDTTSNATPIVRAAARRSLLDISLSAAARIDAHKEREDFWPGTLTLTLTYAGFAEPLELVQDGANLYSQTEPSPIVTLIRGLTADLNQRITRGQ